MRILWVPVLVYGVVLVAGLCYARQSARQALEEVRSSVRAMRSDTTTFDLTSAPADPIRDTDIRLTVVGRQNGADRAAPAGGRVDMASEPGTGTRIVVPS